jgi:serine/threonine-protein kinase
MIHRDIKPTNLFLCRLGTSYDFCKLLDFGLVKRAMAEGSALLTAAGAVAGTPAFMAPEIVSAGTIDGRADIYGLGCVAYWLLTGCLVFDEPNATATIIAHIQKEPVAPSRRTELPIPPDLEKLILACLAKDPSLRPASAAAFKQMLSACSGIEPWLQEDAERWWRINAPQAPAVDLREPVCDATRTAS